MLTHLSTCTPHDRPDNNDEICSNGHEQVDYGLNNCLLVSDSDHERNHSSHQCDKAHETGSERSGGWVGGRLA